MNIEELIEKLVHTEPKIDGTKDAAYKRAVIQMTIEAVVSEFQKAARKKLWDNQNGTD